MPSIFTSKDLEEFRAIWKEEFDEELTMDRARAEAEHLLTFVYDLHKIYQRSLKASKEKGG